jgi:hypothetical protein
MAGDTQQTGEYIDKFRNNKLFECRGRYCGTIGAAKDGYLFKHWMIEGADASNKPELDEDFEALVLDPVEGDCFHYTHDLVPVPIGTPAAIGSGNQFAMGAMAAGANPIEAVIIATEYDTLSGQPVTHLGEIVDWDEETLSWEEFWQELDDMKEDEDE